MAAQMDIELFCGLLQGIEASVIDGRKNQMAMEVRPSRDGSIASMNDVDQACQRSESPRSSRSIDDVASEDFERLMLNSPARNSMMS